MDKDKLTFGIVRQDFKNEHHEDKLNEIVLFIEDYVKKYKDVPAEKIPQKEKEKQLLYIKELLKMGAENFIKNTVNADHEVTDMILETASFTQKKALEYFLIQIELVVKDSKTSNSLFSFFNECLYMFNLQKDSPKLSTETFIERIELMPNPLIKVVFYKSAQLFFELEYEKDKNENNKLIVGILNSKADQIKFQIISNSKKTENYNSYEKENSEINASKIKSTKRTKPTKTPNIKKPSEKELLNSLFFRLEYKGILDCNKTEFNKLFNGAEIGTFTIKWNGSIGLLKSLFDKLHERFCYENKLYYRGCFQFSKKQYFNNKVSNKHTELVTELLK